MGLKLKLMQERVEQEDLSIIRGFGRVLYSCSGCIDMLPEMILASPCNASSVPQKQLLWAANNTTMTRLRWSGMP